MEQTRGWQVKSAAPKKSPASVLPPEIAPGLSLELLQHLHILTRDGRLNQDSRRKLKQVEHLVQFIEPLLQSLPDQGQRATLADHGAGKSYLGFILYDRCFKNRHQSHIWGIDTRPELITNSQTLADKLGFERMTFINQSAAQARLNTGLPEHIDLVTALHACDSATDDAIEFGLSKQARAMVLVPCCQAEAAALLRRNKAFQLAQSPLAELWRHPLHTRELGSQISNVMRCLYLEAQGYKVSVTELVGWEHSLKNELIVAQKTGQNNVRSAQHLAELITQFGLQDLAALRFPRNLESPRPH